MTDTADASFASRDVVAGLCVAGLLLPEAVAYAALAHLPVAHAFTALVVGLALYAVFGGSRFAIVAPTSSTATLAAAAAVSLTGIYSSDNAAAYAQVVMALVLVSGAMLMLLALARQGQLSTFISRPVLKGFAFAVAVSIVVKQLPDALGFELPHGLRSDPFNILLYTLTHAGLWNVYSVGIAVVCAVAIGVLRRWPQVPAGMLVIVVAIGASSLLDLGALGVQQVGSVAPMQLRFGFPDLVFADWVRVGELAFGLVMLVFAESWGSMRSMALAHGDPLDANRELLVLGACNAGAALLQGMPVGAGFSATSANAAAGAVSKKSGAIALAAVLATLVFALPALHFLPRPVLAVAVISALWHSLSPKPLLLFWTMNRDRVLLVGAALGVLVLGVLDGMLAAVGLSVLAALQRFSEPVLHELGELGSTRNYVDVHTQQGTHSLDGVLVLRPEEPLFFGSAERVMGAILRMVRQRPAVQVIVLSLEESADLDSTAVDCLLELHQALRRMGKTLLLARAKTTVRALLERWDPLGLGCDQCLFWSVADAADHAKAQLVATGNSAVIS
jgi:MFS superfamily sulfate permease-like transporter